MLETGIVPINDIIELYLTDENWLGDTRKEDVTVIVSGQSLGGALSLMGAMVFKEVRPRNPIGCITFGAFRVGGEDWKKLFAEKIMPDKMVLRVVRCAGIGVMYCRLVVLCEWRMWTVTLYCELWHDCRAWQRTAMKQVQEAQLHTSCL